MNDKQKLLTIDYFYSKNSFWDLWVVTKKYHELYKSKVAFFSMVIAGASAWLLYYLLFSLPYADFISMLRNALPTLAAGLIGLLGFVIGGLALVSGTIVRNLIKNINRENKSKDLIAILYSFCFEGAIITTVIVLFLMVYLLSYIDQDTLTALFTTVPFNPKYLIIGIDFIIGYLFIFSIFYSITLLITCIRLFLLSYKFSEDDNDIM